RQLNHPRTPPRSKLGNSRFHRMSVTSQVQKAAALPIRMSTKLHPYSKNRPKRESTANAQLLKKRKTHRSNRGAGVLAGGAADVRVVAAQTRAIRTVGVNPRVSSHRAPVGHDPISWMISWTIISAMMEPTNHPARSKMETG